MATATAIDPQALARARELTASRSRQPRTWPVLAAALALACSSLLFAVVMITAPPLTHQHPALARGVE